MPARARALRHTHELMLEQQRFRGDGADATRAEEFREGDKQMDRQEEQIAHESNILSCPPISARLRRKGHSS